MRFLINLSGNKSVCELVEGLDCFIDTRRHKVFQQISKTPEYQKMSEETEQLREGLSTMDAELVGRFETALLREQNYTSTHEYLQGVLDGITLRNVFYSLDRSNSGGESDV